MKKKSRQSKLQEKMTAQRAHCTPKQTYTLCNYIYTWSIKAAKRKPSRAKMKWKQEEEEVNASSTSTPSSTIPEINFVYNVRAFSILFNQYEPSSIE